MGRKIRLTESSLRTIVSESVRRVLNEIKGPSGKVTRYTDAVNKAWHCADMGLNKKSESFSQLAKQYMKQGLEKSHLLDRWNAKYGDIGEMRPDGSIPLRRDWAKRLGMTALYVHWFGNSSEDNDMNAKMRRKLDEWEANGVLPKGAVMLLKQIQDYI